MGFGPEDITVTTMDGQSAVENFLIEACSGGPGGFDCEYIARTKAGLSGTFVVWILAGAITDDMGQLSRASRPLYVAGDNWTVSVSDASATEGTDDTIDFEVSLNGRDDCREVSVDWATADGTAIAGEDYTGASGTLTFAPGETSKTVSVAVLDDTVSDSGETFTLRLSNAVGNEVELGSAEATGTILNDEENETGTLPVLEERGRIDPLIRVLATFLQHFKGSQLSLEEVRQRARSLDDERRAAAFVTVFGPIFERYQETLARAGEVDFHDMINRATEHVEAGRYRSPFGYILVDEFQDISPARARLLKALLDNSPGSQLFAVGDDWQAIYRFGGSDIAVMREFGDRFGAFERIDLETTFRCSDRIAAVATDFVLRNRAQIRKTVRATRKSDGPAVHVGLPGDDELSLLKEALDRISEDAARHDGTSDVLLLGRYRHLQPLNLGSLTKQYPGLRFSYMTVHRSKGLEADYAVVLGLCAGKYGFPVEMADDPLLDLVMAAPEAHSNAEERRLLYVALTRARRQAFLLAEGGPPSPFIRELIDGQYDITVFGRPPEGDVPCPQCKEGRVERRENARDGSIFYGCSNWPYCEHTGRPCPKCGTGLPVRSGDGFRCRDCGGSIESCSSCGGWLETRMGKFGRFLGCSNFPECDYTRNLRKPGPRSGRPPKNGARPSRKRG